MIRLFKRIRRKLLAKGASKNYWLYGLGELLLVVLGIIIALQFDNWNDKRQAQEQVMVNLEKMSQDLQLDSLRIEVCKAQYLRSFQRGETLWKQLYENEPLTKTAEFIQETQAIARTIYFELNNNQFSGMFESNTLKLIPDDGLLNAVLDYYTDYHAEHLFELMQERNIEFQEIVVDAIPLDAHTLILQHDTEGFENWAAERPEIRDEILSNLQINENLALALKNSIRSYLLSLDQLEQKGQQNEVLRNQLKEFLGRDY